MCTGVNSTTSFPKIFDEKFSRFVEKFDVIIYSRYISASYNPTSYPGFSLCGRGLKRTLAKAVKIIHNLWIILSRGMYEQGGTFYRLLNVVSVC